MKTTTLPLCATALLLALFSLPSLAESCYVISDPGVAGPAGAREESCFEHTGMPAGSLDWSCSSKSTGGSDTHKEKRASCPTGYFGKCEAPLTQETLSNQRSSGRFSDEAHTPANLPQNATIITYQYQAKDRGQAKIDCEDGGGKWMAE